MLHDYRHKFITNTSYNITIYIYWTEEKGMSGRAIVGIVIGVVVAIVAVAAIVLFAIYKVKIIS